MKFKIIIFLCCCTVFATAQTYTISGYISDATSGEPLISATVFENKNQKGTVTNEYGFFSLTLPKGNIQLRISYVGFETLKDSLNLSSDKRLNYSLNLATLAEVVVSANQVENISQRMQMSSINLPIKQIEALPMLAGEADILKALALTPGVSAGTEGSTGLLVRGGTTDQNLILLDGATVYNASHLFGFLSVFNTDAINNVELIKGGFPARYGGRLSSVLDITMKEGNRKEKSGEFSVGLLSSKILWESPLGENASYLLSARASYLGLFVLPTKIAYRNGNADQYVNYNLFDINAKINYRFQDDSQLFLSAYAGNDFFKAENGTRIENNTLNLNWGNITTSLRYQKAFSQKLFGHAMLNYTRYQHNLGTEYLLEIPSLDVKQEAKINTISNIQDLSAKFRFDYLPIANHALKFGGEIIEHRFAPSIFQVNTEDTLRQVYTPKIVWNTEMSAFIEDEMTITDRFKINIGLRYSALKTENRWYGGFEPRLAAHYQLNNDWSIKAGYSVMRQYIHLLSNNGVGIPNDIWVPVTDKIAPQSSQQLAIGITKYLPKWNIEASLESYYKKSYNLIDYSQGANFLFDFTKDWQDIVETKGTGEAYGLELFLHKKAGRFNGWTGYTLAWNNRQFDNINNGNWYPAKYDRRHDFEITGSYELNKRWDISATFVYNTGAAITLPDARYETPNSGRVLIYNARNAHRMPDYHRLDIGLNYRPNEKSSWNFSVYNAYNRKNPYYLQIQNFYEFNNGIDNLPTRIYSQLTQKSLFPIIPSVSYSRSF